MDVGPPLPTFGLNAAAGMSLAYNRPGCSSQRVWVRRTLPGLIMGVVATVGPEVSGEDFGNAAGVDVSGGGVRAGRMEEVGSLGAGGLAAIRPATLGLFKVGGETIPSTMALGGRMGGGIPGGGPLFREDGDNGF
mmetsp:Transcript_14111/g.30665  ORF Transcript_14111/g.30665 Transcript_14111/m.30665 type:complete len:135 (-) Transcript_14111:1122-1526(-)